jgi:hypothetical protein
VLYWKLGNNSVNGQFSINNTNFLSATNITLNVTANNGWSNVATTDATSWLIGVNAGDIIQVVRTDDHAQFGIYRVVNAIYSDPTVAYNLTPLATNGTAGPVGSLLAISYSKRGLAGTASNTGATGPTGPYGALDACGLSFADGSVMFVENRCLQEDNPNFNFDNANDILNVGRGVAIGPSALADPGINRKSSLRIYDSEREWAIHAQSDQQRTYIQGMVGLGAAPNTATYAQLQIDTNKTWGIYAKQSANQNYIAGKLSIGTATTTPYTKVQIYTTASELGSTTGYDLMVGQVNPGQNPAVGTPVSYFFNRVALGVTAGEAKSRLHVKAFDASGWQGAIYTESENSFPPIQSYATKGNVSAGVFVSVGDWFTPNVVVLDLIRKGTPGVTAGTGMGSSIALAAPDPTDATGELSGRVGLITASFNGYPVSYQNARFDFNVGRQATIQPTISDPLLQLGGINSGLSGNNVKINGKTITTDTLTVDGGTVVLPRYTKAERLAGNPLPVTGSMIFQTDNIPGLRVYNGSGWVRFVETPD